jgi:integrase
MSAKRIEYHQGATSDAKSAVAWYQKHSPKAALDFIEELYRAAETIHACAWRTRVRKLFRDLVILMRDTGMRNQRDLYRMRIENLDWENLLIFVPDSKTPEGRRLVPMSRRVFEILRERCGMRHEGWVFPSLRSARGHIRSIDHPDWYSKRGHITETCQ